MYRMYQINRDLFTSFFDKDAFSFALQEDTKGLVHHLFGGNCRSHLAVMASVILFLKLKYAFSADDPNAKLSINLAHKFAIQLQQEVSIIASRMLDFFSCYYNRTKCESFYEEKLNTILFVLRA